MWRISLFACVLAVPSLAYSLEKADPDGSADVLKIMAEMVHETRGIEQIRKDNVLIRAAGKNDTDGIRKALRDGALINSRYIDGRAFLDAGETGYTALMFAVLNKQTDALQLLIDDKADLEVKHVDGRTALYIAVSHKRKEAVDLLVKAGAKQDPAKIRLTLDLLAAACKGFDSLPHERYPPYPGGPVGDTSDSPEIVEVLKKGANVNASNPKGYTALMFAANLGLVENVKTLLAHGADASLKSADGETALSLTDREVEGFRVEERRQVVKVLRDHLGKSGSAKTPETIEPIK